MKMKDAKAACRAVGFTLKSEFDEFQVFPIGKNADHPWAYFTNDLQDAVDSANAMAERAAEFNLTA